MGKIINKCAFLRDSVRCNYNLHNIITIYYSILTAKMFALHYYTDCAGLVVSLSFIFMIVTKADFDLENCHVDFEGITCQYHHTINIIICTCMHIIYRKKT